ncbi:conserved membrane hypothetical protein [Tenacibaculum sediminilitoris]|uniref:hypothetical protein n=1 Tax=Tenacibaculum sediminilitoris TaxID=1820334 RepID=UPI00389305DA
MENKIEKDVMNCSFCKEQIEKDVVFCSNCGHPENGTDKERAQFFAKRAMEKSKNIGAGEKIKSARNTLFVLCGIMIVYGFIYYFSTKSILDLGVNFFVALIYLALAFWSEKKPFIALLSGLLLYLTLIIISAIIDPTSIVKGILWKFLIISYIGKGLYSAFDLQKVKTANSNL